ncbi:MAG: nucleotidyltransferase domain-containing protein [Bacteroidota bacterium]
MKEEIANQLAELKKARGIRVLLAVESGSRAWGFPSPDSDFDVRIIYIHPPEWYLSIRQRKDSIDYFHGEWLDINGWDARKALSLLRKSNATPFEWAQSPIVYEEEPGFREKLLALAKDFFQPYHALNHYRGIAKNSYQLNPLSGEIKLKKLFYVIRPILAAKWIVTHQSVPPMYIGPLLPLIDPLPVKEAIEELIRIKATAKEDFVYTLDPAIKAYIDQEMEALGHHPSLPMRETPNVEKLDVYFRELLYPTS